MKPSREAKDLLEAGRLLKAPEGRRERLRGKVMRRVGIGAAGAASALAVTSIAKSGAAAGSKLSVWIAASFIGFGALAGYAGARTWMSRSAALGTAAPRSLVAPVEMSPVEAPAAAAPSMLEQPAEVAPSPPARPSRRASDETPRRVVARNADPPAAPPPAESKPDRLEDLRVEVDLLRQAKEATSGGDASRALALLEQHASRFPNSVLAPERRATRVLALCAAGQTTRARQEASSFLADYPKSPLAPRVKEACAEGPRSR
jgi:hypothetical protein